jgi:uncharacterized phage protein (TIGR02218 family)
MREILPALQARCEAGVTTLCRCWIVRRRDGAVQGFTDHDGDLVVEDVTCRAGTGFDSSEATARFDLSAGGADIAGALSDDTLSEADLGAGRYDAAAVETWMVDWSAPALRVLVARGTLGEVKREGRAFTAELRGLADALAQPSGRLYTARCNADLGDARCRVDLGSPAFHGAGVVIAVESASTLVASGLEDFAEGVFTGGRLTWSGGANAALAVEVKDHRIVAGGARLSLWQAMPQPVTEGDAFAVTAGCDKRFATCRDRFANGANFRGFPHIPGNDFVIAAPEAGAGNDGGSMAG